MLHTQAGYISADCFHHFQILTCSPAADHTYLGDVRFLLPRTGVPRRVEPLLTAIVLLCIETGKNCCPVGGDQALEKDKFKQAFSYEHENHYL
jgi:hypothetical protein